MKTCAATPRHPAQSEQNQPTMIQTTTGTIQMDQSAMQFGFSPKPSTSNLTHPTNET